MKKPCTSNGVFRVMMFLIVLGTCFSFIRKRRSKADNEYSISTLPRAKTQMSFPRVYHAIVPSPKSQINREVGSSFVSQVDLMEVLETASILSELHDSPVGDVYNQHSEDSKRKIAFMIHSERQLDKINQLVVTADDPSFASDLHFSEESTRKLHDQINFSDTDEIATGVRANRKLQGKPPFSTIPGFPCYRDLKGSFAWMASLASRADDIPNLSIERRDIGDSWLKTQDPDQGHDIVALQITGNGVGGSAGDTTTDKGIMFVMSGIHAREYAPPELVARWVDHLVNGYGRDAQITSLLDHTVIHIVMHANPDGRQVAEKNRSEMRRKSMHCEPSRHKCDARDCGIDLNRNFPMWWGRNSGSSDDPCGEDYRGSAPASEPETQAIMNYVKEVFPTKQQRIISNDQVETSLPETIKGVFLDIHSPSSIMVWPWTYEDVASPNDDMLRAMVAKMQHWNGYGFSGPGSDFIYPTSGCSTDFAFGALGTATFAFELGNEFYEKCNFFLQDILPKNIDVLMYAASVAKAPFRLTRGPDITMVQVPEKTFGGMITIQATASDSDLSPSKHPSSQQTIKHIFVYLNEHPDDVSNQVENPPHGKEMTGEFLKSTTVIGTLSFDVTHLNDGRHAVYIQAMDNDGYEGPVQAVWFHKLPPVTTLVDSNNAPCRDGQVAFLDKQGASQTCSWLAAQQPAKQDALCMEGQPAYGVCRETCGVCGEEHLRR